jgi:hypothetical protein
MERSPPHSDAHSAAVIERKILGEDGKQRLAVAGKIPTGMIDPLPR